MDSLVVAEVNDGLERIRQQVSSLEERIEALSTIGLEAARKQEAWAQTLVRLDAEHLELYLRASDSLQEDAARQQLALERRQEQNAENKQQAESDRAELAEMNESIAELRKTLAALPEEQMHQNNEVQGSKEKLEQHLDKLERLSRKSERTEKKLGSTINRYERALGLRIDADMSENICDTISFRFTNIDPTDASREYVVSIRQDSITPNQVKQGTSAETYHAQSCTPYVKEFDALSAAFNANQDMRAFLRGIRAEFRRLSTSEC